MTLALDQETEKLLWKNSELGEDVPKSFCKYIAAPRSTTRDGSLRVRVTDHNAKTGSELWWLAIPGLGKLGSSNTWEASFWKIGGEKMWVQPLRLIPTWDWLIYVNAPEILGRIT